MRLVWSAGGHRADFERERDRAERLMAELLKSTADTIAASAGAAQRRADGAPNPALVEAAGRLRKAPPHAGRHGQGLGDLRQGALPWHLS